MTPPPHKTHQHPPHELFVSLLQSLPHPLPPFSPYLCPAVSHMGKPSSCEKKDTNKGAWSKQEDEKLINYIRVHGEGRWRSLPQAAGLLRCGKSCRLRWINYLRPDLKRGSFTEDEEDLIIKLHALLGNRWSLIAGRLPGRTDNEIKNYWNSHLRRKLVRMGLDPKNHRLSNMVSNLRGLCWPKTLGNAALGSLRSIHMCSSCATRPDRSTADEERVSDEASSAEGNSLLLNLDLNISLPSPPDGLANQKQHPEAEEMKRGPYVDASPTLLLFR
ncbi:hypothetical protein Taro_035078 [Colocasia esculenta]|uniref:Uncharacterized protein n=1 Tax=Colocasia esculenta TaxID=4460 RepID=A0A843WDS6_COLES|nr:hypothetical protein [Colocasia esculenta]